MQMTLSEIGAAMQAVGEIEANGDLEVSRVQTDSRLVEPGDLFVCLPGSRFDGHQFAGEAVQKGAVAVVSERPLRDMLLDAPVLLVQSSLEALGRLAGAWRTRFGGEVVAVTGSAGKTSVKEFLASALEAGGQEVARNFKNWNNQLGLPLSMLGFSGREAFWVLEAGVNYAGEMDILGRILQPDMALITNVGPVHLEGLKSLRGVAEEKAVLLSALRADGRAVISCDYPELVQAVAKAGPARTVCFSLKDAQKAYFGEYLGSSADGGRYRLSLRGRWIEVGLAYQGEFLLENILAAAAAASELGVPASAVKQGLERTELPEHRCRLERCGPYLLVDDCYNANPLSMRRSAAMAREAAGGGRLWAILGEMKELGEQAAQEHETLGRTLAEQGVEAVLFVGAHAADLRRGFSTAAPPDRVLAVEDEEELLQAMRRLGLTEGTVLVKGSRGCRMERFVQLLAGGVEL